MAYLTAIFTQEPFLHGINDANAPISNSFRRLVKAILTTFWFYDFKGVKMYGDFMLFYVLLGVWQMSSVLWKLFKDCSKLSTICHYVPKEKKQQKTKISNVKNGRILFFQWTTFKLLIFIYKLLAELRSTGDDLLYTLCVSTLY